MSLLDDEAKIVTSRLGPRRFRIAGTAEFNGKALLTTPHPLPRLTPLGTAEFNGKALLTTPHPFTTPYPFGHRRVQRCHATSLTMLPHPLPCHPPLALLPPLQCCIPLPRCTLLACGSASPCCLFPSGYNRDIRHDRIVPLVGWCNKHFPELSTEDITPWSGLRPMMPSMLPRIGAGAQPGVF